MREAALILLYRLLFVLYAEDRNLLPEVSGPYADFCLSNICLEIAERKVAGRQFSESFVTYWPRLTSIFRVVAKGDDPLGIPPYNGGLFESATAPILDRVQLPDPIVADVIFGLSHEVDDGLGPKYINYRDLSVQQLGSVYERILEFGLRRDGKGGVEIDADDEARHRSGSYYTLDDLVSLVIAKAVGPLVTERVAAFEAKAKELESSRLTKQERLAALTEVRSRREHTSIEDLRSRDGLRTFSRQSRRLACGRCLALDGGGFGTCYLGRLRLTLGQAHRRHSRQNLEPSRGA